ncbi:MAG: helix-turn-helix domain-containing protein [Patescibacteria group bacterium]|jgi:sugar-specific transcriptional regulator TrmB
MIQQLIEKLGFTKNEALVYSALVEKSPSGASLIARKTNLSRSSVYTALSDLQSKGLVSTTYKNEVKQFIVEDYNVLEQMVEKEKAAIDQKFQLVKNLKEQFKILGNQDLSIPQITFFEGQEGLKKIYLSMLRQAKENETMLILRDEFVWSKEWSFVFDREWHDLVKHFKVERGIKTKLLINDSATERDKAKYYQTRNALEFRLLPKSTVIKEFAIYVVGDMVSILSFESGGLVGIRITNQHLAGNFSQIFASLWQCSSV